MQYFGPAGRWSGRGAERPTKRWKGLVALEIDAAATWRHQLSVLGRLPQIILTDHQTLIYRRLACLEQHAHSLRWARIMRKMPDTIKA